MPFIWLQSPLGVFPPGYRTWMTEYRAEVLSIMQARAEEIKDWMKTNAPWRDVSGQARDSLDVFVSADTEIITVTVSHGVFYGIYLENSNGGTYSIIVPTINYWGPILMDDFR